MVQQFVKLSMLLSGAARILLRGEARKVSSTTYPKKIASSISLYFGEYLNMYNVLSLREDGSLAPLPSGCIVDCSVLNG